MSQKTYIIVEVNVYGQRMLVAGLHLKAGNFQQFGEA